jgi:hypothetical protein
LLRRGHHGGVGAKRGVGFLQNSTGALEEFLTRKKLLHKVVRLKFGTHAENISEGEEKEKRNFACNLFLL